jgi:hypothetical protein
MAVQFVPNTRSQSYPSAQNEKVNIAPNLAQRVAKFKPVKIPFE